MLPAVLERVLYPKGAVADYRKQSAAKLEDQVRRGTTSPGDARSSLERLDWLLAGIDVDNDGVVILYEMFRHNLSPGLHIPAPESAQKEIWLTPSGHERLEREMDGIRQTAQTKRFATKIWQALMAYDEDKDGMIRLEEEAAIREASLQGIAADLRKFRRREIAGAPLTILDCHQVAATEVFKREDLQAFVSSTVDRLNVLIEKQEISREEATACLNAARLIVRQVSEGESPRTYFKVRTTNGSTVLSASIKK